MERKDSHTHIEWAGKRGGHVYRVQEPGMPAVMGMASNAASSSQDVHGSYAGDNSLAMP